MIDVLVAGGGPAGLATAIHAALRGMEAVVVEPRPGVIDKACGEGLMPPSLFELQQMGLDPTGHPFLGIRYVDGDTSTEACFPGGPGRGVRRTVLHESLLQRADALGVRFVEGRVGAVRQSSDRVLVDLGGDGLEAAWLVAADGLHSPLRRHLGLEEAPRHAPRYGIRRHYATAPWSRFVEVHWSPEAEAYVTPVAPDCVGVAVLFSGRGSFEHWLECFPALQERLSGPCTPAAGGGPFEQRVRRRLEGRVLLVGDAAGFLDPITGEGIRLGLTAARTLIRCLAEKRPETYEGAWRDLSRHYYQMTTLLLWAARTRWIRPRLVPLIGAVPGLFRAGLRFLTS